MKKKIIDAKKYPKKCEYCARGKLAPNGEDVLCQKKGIVDKDSKCRAYKYDVLKRVPIKAKNIMSADPEDFKL